MKHERTLESQVRKIDRDKSNTAVVVDALPNNGREGDLIHVGEPPAPPDEITDGYYLRLNGEWRFIGTGQAVTPTQPDPDPEPEEENIDFLSKMEDPVTPQNP